MYVTVSRDAAGCRVQSCPRGGEHADGSIVGFSSGGGGVSAGPGIPLGVPVEGGNFVEHTGMATW